MSNTTTSAGPQATIANITAPLTKTQKRKQKKQLKDELKQRAKMIAEKQKQGLNSGSTSSKTSEFASSSEKLSSVVATNKQEDSIDASEDVPSQSDNGSSDSSTGSDQVSSDDSLPSRAKKIREFQQQQNRQKSLLDLGGGIVESEKPSNFRKQQASRKRRQLIKHDKVKHNSANPVANLILKHQNDSLALNAAAQRIAEQQEMRKAQNTRAKGKHSLAAHFNAPSMEREQELFANRAKQSLELFLSAMDQAIQRKEEDDMSDRCVTIASDSDHENVPELFAISKDHDTSQLGAHSTLFGAAVASDANNADMPEPVIRSTTFEDEDVVMRSYSSATSNNLDEGDFVSALSDLEDQADEAGASEDWTTSDDTGTPDNGTTPAGTVTPDGPVTHRNGGNPDDIAILDASGVPLETILPEEPARLNCAIEVVSVIAEEASHTLLNDVSATPIESGSDLPIAELPKTESSPSWISSMLSLPNATRYPPALPLDREVALIAKHITRLALPESKKAPKTAKSCTKATSEPSVSSNAAIQASFTDLATTIEPTGLEMLVNNDSTQIDEFAVADLFDQTLSSEEKPSVDGAAEIPGFVARMLTRPNGSGQTAAARELHETVVRLHVPALEFPSGETKKLKNPSKTSTEHIASNEDVVTDTLLPLVEITATSDAPSAEYKTDAVEQIMALENPNTPLLKPLSDNGPVSDIKVIEVDLVTSSSENSKFPDISRRSSPTSKPSESSKTSSRPSSVRSNELLSNDLEQKLHKARNTYLGIASLEDFLMLLDFDENTGSTTKTAIRETFTTLSADEADIIQGHRPTELPTDLPTAYAQRRVKLGSTTLSAFLRDVVFDTEDMTHVTEVMRSFKNAALHDVQPSSKLAAAFFLESASSAESSPVSSPLLGFRSGSGSPSPQLSLSRSGLCLE